VFVRVTRTPLPSSSGPNENQLPIARAARQAIFWQIFFVAKSFLTTLFFSDFFLKKKTAVACGVAGHVRSRASSSARA
jgi:hypothetical protein